MGQLTPFQHNVVNGLALTGGSISIVLTVLMLYLYFLHPKRSSVKCFINSLCAFCAVLQLLQTIARVVFSIYHLAAEVTPLSCDMSASIDQFFDPAAQTVLIEVFFVLAFLRLYAPSQSRSPGYIVVPLGVGALTLLVMWSVMSVTSTATGHFTAIMPWCWIPKEANHISATELVILRLFCAYIFFFAIVLIMIFSAYRLRYKETKGASWSANGLRRLQLRFIGIGVMPCIAYSCGFCDRFFHVRHIALVYLQAVSFTLMPAFNALAFIVSEDLIPFAFPCLSKSRGAHTPDGLTGQLSMLGCLAVEGAMITDFGATDSAQNVLDGRSSDIHFREAKKEEAAFEQAANAEDIVSGHFNALLSFDDGGKPGSKNRRTPVNGGSTNGRTTAPSSRVADERAHLLGSTQPDLSRTV